MCYWGRGGRYSPIFLKLQESWSLVGHPAIEIATIYSATFFISSSILLPKVVGQIFKTPTPHPQKVSRYISARRQFTSFGIVVQKQCG